MSAPMTLFRRMDPLYQPVGAGYMLPKADFDGALSLKVKINDEELLLIYYPRWRGSKPQLSERPPEKKNLKSKLML